ncbi:MDR family MFS transporter [Nocardioides sp. Kera G14]|uniref:MDR family MFS transporter n=1 Tax=Nocardioides sp. Kera G14 TaxID=2884264 RepID=UPI001D125407|nr:MDR family MFS transporter [Nocardioides sp. Kera G14]UDY23736.1 multidrug efflux MFS transporter [Nocardioides sp. Kera G14]
MSVSKSDQPKLDPHVIRVALALIAGIIAVIFDTTIVSVAIHDLGDDLHTSVSTIQWVSTGYLLAMFVAIPATGWLQARVGGKNLWIASIALFLLGSVLCATAWDATSLIGFRVIQGLGGGIMMPLMTTLLLQAAGGQNLGRLMSIVGLPASLGPILGPILGGIILNWLSWQWLFLVNVPVCLVGMWLAWRMLPADRPAPGSARPVFDAIGFGLLTPGVVAILFGLSNVSKDGGFGRGDVWIPAVIGVALVVAFVVWAAPRRERALLDVHLLRHRPLALGTGLLLLTGAALYGSMLLLPLYFQELRGSTALTAGLLLIPQGVGTLLSRTFGGRLTDDVGPQIAALVGFGILTIATVPFAFADANTSMWCLGLVLFVRGLGLGIAFTPLMSVAFLGLQRHEMPDASVFTRVAQQLGGSFGTAILAVILEAAVTSGAGPVHGFQVSFWWTVGFVAVAVVLSFLLPRSLTQPEAAPAEIPVEAPGA